MNTSLHEAHRITLESRLEIREVDVWLPKFIAAFERCADIVIDVSRLEAIDTAGMQLLLAVCREAKHCRVSLNFAGHSESMLKSLAAVGLIDQVIGSAG